MPIRQSPPASGPRRRRALAPALAVFALATLAALPVRAAEVERPFDRSFDAAAIHEIRVENLAGQMTVVAGTGSKIRISGTVYADRSDGATAPELADSLRIDFDATGDLLVVGAEYPTSEHRRYYYPRSAGQGVEIPEFLAWFGGSGTTTRYRGVSVRVVGSPSSGAATLYADFRIEVPPGVAVEAKNSIGLLRSDGVHGDQKLDTSAGTVEAANGSGKLVADTGSGDVHVRNHQGDVSADTGSGDVHMENVTGEKLVADTGSGDVELVACRGSIDADTGSGDVTGRDVVVGQRFRADTGSGDVRFTGDFGAVRNLYVDTGSGDVALTMSAVPSVRLKVSTGSGDIDLDVTDARVHSLRHGDLVADLGAAEGDGTIDTGSGDVRLRSNR